MFNIKVSAISAVALNRTIGKDGGIPWQGKLPGEQALFKKCTEGKPVIMGRKTWESLPAAVRPLPNRTNIVLTSKPSLFSDRFEFDNLEDALIFCDTIKDAGEAVLIGGQRVYEEGLKYCSTLYLSELEAIYPGDSFFPEFDKNEWGLTFEKNFPMTDKRPISYKFRIYRR